MKPRRRFRTLRVPSASVMPRYQLLSGKIRSDGMHDNSGINIQNLNPNESQTVEIRLITNVGVEVLPEPFLLTMPPGGNNFVYLPNLAGVPAGTVAAARITSQDPFGFVALSNDVNYAVPGDGSVTFMAAGEIGYYRLLGSLAP